MSVVLSWAWSLVLIFFPSLIKYNHCSTTFFFLVERCRELSLTSPQFEHHHLPPLQGLKTKHAFNVLLDRWSPYECKKICFPALRFLFSATKYRRIWPNKTQSNCRRNDEHHCLRPVPIELAAIDRFAFSFEATSDFHLMIPTRISKIDTIKRCTCPVKLHANRGLTDSTPTVTGPGRWGDSLIPRIYEG